MRFLVLLTLLAIATAVPARPAAAAAHEIEVALPEDSSRALAQAILYEAEVPHGSDYRCRFQVVRPDAGEKPLRSPKNRLVCSFTTRTGTEAYKSVDFEATDVMGSTSRMFLMAGDLPLNLISVALTTISKLGDPLPKTALWAPQVKCDARGVECQQELILYSRAKIPGQPVPVMICQRHSILTATTPQTRVDRTKFATETAYLNELLYRQILAHERGHDSNACGVLYDQTRPITPAPEAVHTQADPRADVRTADLAQLTLVSREPKGPIFKYAFNRFQVETGLTPGLSQSISDDALAFRQKLERQGMQADARMQFLKPALEEQDRLKDAFPGFEREVIQFLLLLSLVPDPDRWFLLAGLHSLEIKTVPESEFLALLPERLRALGSQAVSWRRDRTLYFNEGFIRSGHFRPGQSDGFELLLFWETIKLWVPADADPARVSERFSRAITQGTLEEFKARDASGTPGLTFVSFVESLVKSVRATTAWRWAATNAYYYGQEASGGYDVELYAPIQLRSAGGTVRDTFPLQYLTAKPATGDPKEIINFIPPDVKLFCGEAAAKASGSFAVDVAPQFARFEIRGLTPAWRGIREPKSQALHLTFKSEADCVTGLDQSLRRLVEQVSDYYRAGLPPFSSN